MLRGYAVSKIVAMHHGLLKMATSISSILMVLSHCPRTYFDVAFRCAEKILAKPTDSGDPRTIRAAPDCLASLLGESLYFSMLRHYQRVSLTPCCTSASAHGGADDFDWSIYLQLSPDGQQRTSRHPERLLWPTRHSLLCVDHGVP